MEGVNVAIDEGASCTDQAVTHLAFAALPDGRTCLCLQYVVAASDRLGYLAEIRDLHLAVPNDLFNGCRRTLWTSSGQTVLHSPPDRTEVLEFEGRWANIDDCLGIVALHGADRILVDRSATRRGGRYRSLFTEDICLHLRQDVSPCSAGTVLADVGFAVLSGVSAEATAAVRGGSIPLAGNALRGVWAEGADGTRYVLAANFGLEKRTVDVCGESMTLDAGMAQVHRS
jgi:hypothetical protein